MPHIESFELRNTTVNHQRLETFAGRGMPMLASVLSRAQYGMEAPEVTIDVHIGPGIPMLMIVGLPETTVKESKDRVRSALINSGLNWPAGHITINLSPADLPKEGGRFDLPIALAILAATGQIPARALIPYELYGELSLGGELRPVRGMLPTVNQATRLQRPIIFPLRNVPEAQLVENAKLIGAANLVEVIGHLRGTRPLSFATPGPIRLPRADYPDLTDVRGQAQARRALEIAAAGAHSLLLIGPPGTGKSMLAHRLPGILPPLTAAEALETAAIASVSRRGFDSDDWFHRPFRAPHHTSSAIALVGGGSHPTPGEISLAHNGVLFLDELPEYDRGALESLREPLETGCVTISRAAHRAEFPARFQLIAAMNPCPCGYLHDGTQRCRCSHGQIERYQSRISGPLLERLDLHVRIHSIDPISLRVGQWQDQPKIEASATVAARVADARDIQLQRQDSTNARLDTTGIDRYCTPDTEGRDLLEHAARRFNLSARAYHRILRCARTIADLERADIVTAVHVTEALLFRQLDRRGPGPPTHDRSYAPVSIV